jgi:hypothetical protein
MTRSAAPFRDLLKNAALRVIDQAAVSFGGRDDLVHQFPFLEAYCYDADDPVAPSGHAPLRAIQQAAGLDDDAVTLWLAIGLLEEDARFGLLFESLQNVPGQHRPTVGLLTAWWRDEDGCDRVRSDLRQLLDLGLVQVVNPEAPRLEWALQPPSVLWDALRGQKNESPAGWARFHPPEDLLPLDSLILPPGLREQLRRLPSLLAAGDLRALILRGPRHNGRRTALGAVARAMRRGVLEIATPSRPEEERWRLIGLLATLLEALPVLVLNAPPGETVEVPALTGYRGPVGLVLGRYGSVTGAWLERALTVWLEIPGPETRLLHWQSALGAGADHARINDRFRMTTGNIHRTAALARSHAALAGRRVVTLADAAEASRALQCQALDTLATRIPACGDWTRLAVDYETMQELRHLEGRCRHRERLAGAHPNCGVRALLKGPSGAGKTLAARLLASVLQMDLYRLDLSTVVNKYIGETEKNLNQILSRAEELNVVLLLDEGDALLTQRTAVLSSNDRYANLETNYLLQRLESFEGILIVTTNAADRIDSAFQRRMDVVIDFRPPDAAERWTIWQLHLPPEHAADLSLLGEIAGRCALTGGQIRNAVLHASLLALENGGRISSAHLEAAVRREYRKAGADCPLRPLFSHPG